MDFKGIIEQATGEPAEYTAFIPGEAPELPFIIILDKQTRTGADLSKGNAGAGVIIHDLTIERYTIDSTRNAGLDALMETFDRDYTFETLWLPSPDNCYEQIYEIQILERT